MQENRSFDSYFGTYHNIKGIPKNVGIPIDPDNPIRLHLYLSVHAFYTAAYFVALYYFAD
jgi:hypothetical protein